MLYTYGSYDHWADDDAGETLVEVMTPRDVAFIATDDRNVTTAAERAVNHVIAESRHLDPEVIVRVTRRDGSSFGPFRVTVSIKSSAVGITE